MSNNQFNQDHSDLVSNDFYSQFNFQNSSHSSRLNSKSSSNDMNSESLFNSISSPSKSSPNEISSPESLKTSSHSSQMNVQRPRINPSQHLVAPNFNTSERSSSSRVSNNTESGDDSQITKLFVGNLPTSTTLPELLNVFKKYGPVNEKLSVVKDQNYAFIHFYNRRDAQIALQEVNDSLFKDRYIRVQFSTSQGYTFNNKHKFTDNKKRYNNYNTDSNNKPTHSHVLHHSASNSSIFNQQTTNRNYRPITGKSFNQQNVPQTQQSNINTVNHQNNLNDFQQTQNQLMHLLYLAQLQQQQQEQQNFTRSSTFDNISLHNDTPINSASLNQAFLMSNFASNIQNSSMLATINNNNNHNDNNINHQSSQQQSSSGMVRSNTMFSFPNNFNLKR